MINCPKCNELIGNDVISCPFCKTQITQEYRREIFRKNERFHDEAINEVMDEYTSRIRIEIITAIVMIVLAGSGMFVIALYDLNVIWGMILFAFLFLIYVFSVIKFRIRICPYCESFMGKGILFRRYCPRCGGRLMR